jgi:predicted lipoprotein with Yx(FWY)xxD motif
VIHERTAPVSEGMKQTHGGGQNGGGNTRLRIAVALLATVSAVALAACGDDDSGDDGAGATAASGGSETVSVESIGDAGDVLVDETGAALYRSDQESSGKVACTGGCTEFWAPVTVAGGGAPTGSAEIEEDLGTVKRPDGNTQVTFDGKPLYSFTDEGPGEVTGDGFTDAFDGTTFTWHVMTASGSGSEDGGDTSSPDPGDGGSPSY